MTEIIKLPAIAKEIVKGRQIKLKLLYNYYD